MTCLHMQTSHKWVEKEDYWTGETTWDWETTTEYTTTDLDTHRYQCTQCKKVMYYSGAARAYYEDGKPSVWVTED